MFITNVFRLFYHTFNQWRQEDVTRLGAALAFYAAFSLLPLLLVMTALAGYLLGAEQVENQVGQFIYQLVGDTAATTIKDAVEAVNGGIPGSAVSTLIALAALLYGTTGLFRHLKNALNVIWKVPDAAPNKVRGFIKDTLMSFVMVLGVGLLLLVTMVIHALLFTYFRVSGNGDFRLMQVVGFALLFVFTLLAFATIYKVLPDAHVVWSDVWMGAAVTAVLFTLGQLGVAILLSNSTIDTLYGAASTLVFVLVWVHISSHIVLVGAEFTRVYANRYGSKIVPTEVHEQEKAAEANPV